MPAEDHDDPVDRLLDLFVYAPIGLLTVSSDHLDEFVTKGRQRAAMARTLGAFALAGADDRIGRSMADLEAMAREFFRIVVENTSMRPEGTAGASTARSVEDVIPDYDDLTAKQVIERLGDLDRADLDIVEAHERAHRNRSTILARIGRLRS